MLKPPALTHLLPPIRIDKQNINRDEHDTQNIVTISGALSERIGGILYVLLYVGGHIPQQEHGRAWRQATAIYLVS